jgi:hypothetical protein
MDEQQTQDTDAGLEELFTEETPAGTEDVENTSDQLTLEELSKTLGREFKSKEEALKHAENLKKFSGDQEAIKERKAQKELEKKTVEEKTLKEELEQVKKDLAKKDFLVESPTAKDYLDIIEAYAEKNGITLVEAWNSEKFKPIAEASMRVQKQVITNNRITPVQAQTVNKLVEEVKTTGSDDAKIKLVKEYLK